MAERTNFEVVAWLKMRGDFQKQMRRAAESASSLWRRMNAMGAAMQRFGTDWAGAIASQISSWGKLGATIAGVMGLVTGAGAIASGLKFNKTLEDSQLQIATMYQLFDFLGDSSAVVNGQISQWNANLGVAKGTMTELYEIAKRTPGSYKDILGLYTQSAAGLASQTKDLERHMDFVERAALLGGLTGGDYDVLGAQIGRIIAGNAGAEMTPWQVLKGPITEAGKELGVFDKNLNASADMVQKFNQLTGDNRLKLMMKAMDKIGPDVAKSFGESMSGITGTTMSAFQQITGALTAPLYDSFRRFLVRVNSEDGVLGGKGLDRLIGAAKYFGGVLDRAGDWLFAKVAAGVDYLAHHWQDLTNTMFKAFQIGSALIKGAFAYGVTKLIAGTAIATGGAAMRGVGALGQGAGWVKEFMSPRTKAAHMGLARGMAGKGRGMTGAIGGGLGKVFGKLGNDQGAFRLFRGLDKLVLKFSALGMSSMAAGVAIGAVALVLGALAVAVAGIGVWFVANWEKIRDSIVKGLRDGSISLKPVVAAAYVLWHRLLAVGQMFMGNATGAGMARAAIGYLTKMIMFAADSVSFFMKVIGIFLGVWGTLKLAFLGLMKVVLMMIQGLAKVGILDQGKADQAQRNYDAYSRSVEDTWTNVDSLLRKADELKRINLDTIDFTQVDKKAEDMAKGLADWMEKLGASKDGPKTPTQPVVKVNKVELNWDLRGEDPDNLMVAFVKPLERLADRRIQAYDQIEQGG